MALRGFLRKKLQPKMSPQNRRIYVETLKKESVKIQQGKRKLEISKIKERAKRDAIRASTTKSQVIGRGLLSAGKSIGKKLEKFDNEKFEAYVTGVSTNKKKKQ